MESFGRGRQIRARKPRPAAVQDSLHRQATRRHLSTIGHGDEGTRGILRELAKADGVSLNEELARAVEARRRERFFADLTAGYADLTERERRDELSERALWDGTLRDGVDDE